MNERQLKMIVVARQRLVTWQPAVRRDSEQRQQLASVPSPLPPDGFEKLKPLPWHLDLQNVEADIQSWKGLRLNNNYANDLSFTPDGTQLASGSNSEAIRLWHIKSINTVRKLLDSFIEKVSSVQVSPDGTKLAAGSDDSTLELWDLNTGKVLHTLEPRASWVNSVEFAPRGDILASGSMEGKVVLWDTTTGQRRGDFDNQDRCVNSVSFSPDGSMIVTGSDDDMIRLWAVKDERTELQNVLYGDNGQSINSVKFSPDGTQVLSGSDDTTMKLWNITTGEQRVFKGHRKKVTTVAFCPKLGIVASGSEDMTIGVWDVSNGARLRTLRDHKRGLNAVTFSPNGELLASSSYDDEVRLWDTKTWTSIIASNEVGITNIPLNFGTEGDQTKVEMANGSEETYTLIEDDTGTVYSFTSQTDLIVSDALEELASQLTLDMSGDSISCTTDAQLRSLADAVKTFTRRLHEESTNPFQWETSVSLHLKQRQVTRIAVHGCVLITDTNNRDIVRLLIARDMPAESLSKEEPDEFEIDDEGLDGRDDETRLHFQKPIGSVIAWRDSVQSTDVLPLDSDPVVSLPPSEESETPEWAVQKRFVCQSHAYHWLVDHLRQQCRQIINDCTPEPAIEASVREHLREQQVLNKMSRRKPSGTIEMTVNMMWDSDVSTYRCGREGSTPAIFDKIYCLTGSETEAQVVTIEEYVNQIWPVTGTELLGLLHELMTTPVGESCFRKSSVKFSALRHSSTLQVNYRSRPILKSRQTETITHIRASPLLGDHTSFRRLWASLGGYSQLCKLLPRTKEVFFVTLTSNKLLRKVPVMPFRALQSLPNVYPV